MDRTEFIFEAEVTHVSNQGYGVIKGPDRVTYFARGTWRGDYGRFQVADAWDGDYQFVEVLAILRPSIDRREAPCPHLGPGTDQCFGCPWMMVDDQAQLREKQHRVVYALERVGLQALPVATIWPSPTAFHYRRRAQFKTNGESLGYAGRQGLAIAPIVHCLVLTDAMQKQLQALRARLPETSWKPGPGHIWNYLDIDEDTDPQQLSINRRRPFQQANAEQNKAMRGWLAEQLASHHRADPILELFAGSGNFTEVLVEQGFSQITALEVGADAIEQLQKKAWPGVEAKRMDLYGKHAAYDVARAAQDARVLIANPPRAGLGTMWRTIPSLPSLQTVILISCDPHSFAGDARRLIQLGFTASRIQPLDQMPHTPHVEVLARFDR
ncbi:MAG TPA: hypothetical protein VE954_01045 [Oligoflexus sp.]|uniref:class I SAM-dependent RNA methyltransferase n=1 Tax=Oligoflexus sp. TaxID=1971216 RepID=UPI002D3EA949|nr:hypothetical protein [Oligoflexus sp.]HYX31667.1 hypothetical protein [Oligoflexus sp.]